MSKLEEGQRERENLQEDAPLRTEPDTGPILRPQDHNQSRNQDSAA